MSISSWKNMNHGQNFKRKKKGNAFNHLDKFTAVQQLALFAPDIGEYSRTFLGLRLNILRLIFSSSEIYFFVFRNYD